MEYSFPRYLLSKQTVDDRALNRVVLEALKSALSVYPFLSVIEVGAGIGTMLARLLRWGILPPSVDYTLVDEMPENIVFAKEWLPRWARENGYQVETMPDGDIRFLAPAVEQVSASQSVPISVSVHFVQADVFDFIRSSASSVVQPADLLIAHAFLDLLPMPESLPRLFSLVKSGGASTGSARGLAWLTINFDGVTTFEPPIHSLAPAVGQASVPHPLGTSASSADNLDATIERLYHQTMDTRPTGGDSQSGRHLFGYLKQAGGEILSAGASDWVVYPVNGQYRADEAYFLHFILHFFENSLGNRPDLDKTQFANWVAARRAQIDRGELVYIAHQMDFLVAPTFPPPNSD
jgi:hypothetical protein